MNLWMGGGGGGGREGGRGGGRGGGGRGREGSVCVQLTQPQLCHAVMQERISIACQPHLAALCPVQTELLTVFTDSQSPVLLSTHIHTPLQL